MTAPADARHVSNLLDLLPAVFQEDRAAGAADFLGRFLLAFERLLLGMNDSLEPGLEETIARLYRYFEPDPGETLDEHERAPREFLQWLAGWVALTLREDWDELRQRDLIARAVPLYRLRGTRRGVEEFLRIYTRLGVRIDELNTPFQIGVHSTVGTDTILDGGAPFFFRVFAYMPVPESPSEIKIQYDTAQAIVELQKPAHTLFDLKIVTPTFQVGVNSTVGVDTLVG